MPSHAYTPFTERVPTYDELNWPALEALRNLGGSASIADTLRKLSSNRMFQKR
jgi:hypothetical protein